MIKKKKKIIKKKSKILVDIETDSLFKEIYNKNLDKFFRDAMLFGSGSLFPHPDVLLYGTQEILDKIKETKLGKLVK